MAEERYKKAPLVTGADGLDEPTDGDFRERWATAQVEAERIRRALSQGYLVMDGDKRVTNMQVTDEGVFEEHGRSKSFWFMNDRDLDNGMFTPVEKIRAQFRRVNFYGPIEVADEP